MWSAYTDLGKVTSDAGPLSNREKRLVKLALAVGAGSEGAVHSHTRRAKIEGPAATELEHVALLAVGTLGLPQAVAAKTWIEDMRPGGSSVNSDRKL